MNKFKCLLPTLSMIVLLYLTQIRSKVPNIVIQLFENSLVRLAILGYIVYKSSDNPQTSIIITFGFLLILQSIGSPKTENFTTQLFKNDEDIIDEKKLLNDNEKELFEDDQILFDNEHLYLNKEEMDAFTEDPDLTKELNKLLD